MHVVPSTILQKHVEHFLIHWRSTHIYNLSIDHKITLINLQEEISVHHKNKDYNWPFEDYLDRYHHEIQVQPF